MSYPHLCGLPHGLPSRLSQTHPLVSINNLNAISRFCSASASSASAYYLVLERGFARLYCVKKNRFNMGKKVKNEKGTFHTQF